MATLTATLQVVQTNADTLPVLTEHAPVRGRVLRGGVQARDRRVLPEGQHLRGARPPWWSSCSTPSASTRGRCDGRRRSTWWLLVGGGAARRRLRHPDGDGSGWRPHALGRVRRRAGPHPGQLRRDQRRRRGERGIARAGRQPRPRPPRPRGPVDPRRNPGRRPADVTARASTSSTWSSPRRRPGSTCSSTAT